MSGSGCRARPRRLSPGGYMPHDGLVSFNYGRSFRELRGAIPLYLPGTAAEGRRIAAAPRPDNAVDASRDAAPDAWGRRVILNRKFGVKGDEIGKLDLSELTFLLESGSDRIGALDFQSSPTHYESRAHWPMPLSKSLSNRRRRVEKGIRLLTPELDQGAASRQLDRRCPAQGADRGRRRQACR